VGAHGAVRASRAFAGGLTLAGEVLLSPVDVDLDAAVTRRVLDSGRAEFVAAT